MGERIDLATTYFRAIKITTQAWGKFGMLAIHQIAIVDPLLRRAKLTNNFAKSLGFAPTDGQKINIRRSDPVINQPNMTMLIARPTESLTVSHERIAFGVETLNESYAEAQRKMLELASETKELALLFPFVIKIILFGAPSEKKS